MKLQTKYVPAGASVRKLVGCQVSGLLRIQILHVTNTHEETPTCLLVRRGHRAPRFRGSVAGDVLRRTQWWSLKGELTGAGMSLHVHDHCCGLRSTGGLSS